MQSVERRLGSITQEVIQYTQKEGVWEAMRRYEVKGYDVFRKFLENHTGNPNFGLYAAGGRSADGNQADNLLDAVIRRLHQADATIEALKAELHSERLAREYERGQRSLRDDPKVAQILSLCKE